MIKIISGGQTGVDRMALELAKEMGITTGGYAPKGYLTENGPDLSLELFGLSESEIEGYPYRTKLNIKLAHGTILFGNTNSRGSQLVIRYCIENFHPIIINPTWEKIIEYVNNLKQICTYDGNVILNIAGNRGSKISQEDLDNYKKTLYLGLKPFK